MRPQPRRVYIAGQLLRWREQHKRGPRGVSKGIFLDLFYVLHSVEMPVEPALILWYILTLSCTGSG